MLEASLKFQQWKQTLERNGVLLEGYEPLAIIPKGKQLLFAMLKAKMRCKEGYYLPSIVVLRGHFVSIMPVLIAQETEKKYLLLVKQRRVATGGYFYEFPCGMCDEEQNVVKVAQKELKEETGLYLPEEDFHLLNERPFYTSQGLLDEGGFFFYVEKTLPLQAILRFHGQQQGAQQENERIEVVVVSLEEAPKYLNHTSGLTHYYLYLKRR